MATETDGLRTVSGDATDSRIVRLPYGGTLTILANGKGYSYAYGPSGIAGLRHNYYSLTSAIFASIGGLLFGYDQGVIANVLVMSDFRQRFGMSAWQEGLMSEWITCSLHCVPFRYS